jgi:cytidylate kinase
MVEKGKMVIEFVTERETKNMFRYQEILGPDNPEPCIGTLYVSKKCIRAANVLRNLKVTIEDAGRG